MRASPRRWPALARDHGTFGRARHAAFCAALCAVLCGCMVDLNTFEACERDPETCASAGQALPILPGCTATDELHVELGTGEFGFSALAPGQSLQLHEGTPLQSSALFHVFVGVKIVNPDPVGGKFRVLFRVFEPDPTKPGAVRASVAPLVLRDSLDTAADGSLVRAGVRVFVFAAPTAVTVEVDDQCGRHAQARHEIAL